MNPAFYITPVTALHPDMQALQAEAAAEGFHIVDRLMKDWLSTANIFDRPSELFLGGFLDNKLLGFCGLNVDPYMVQDGVARLRHLYVRRDARRNGVATALVKFILNEAKGNFHLVRLRTDTREAAEFYVRLGFESVNDATASHIVLLREAAQNI